MKKLLYNFRFGIFALRNKNTKHTKGYLNYSLYKNIRYLRFYVLLFLKITDIFLI